MRRRTHRFAAWAVVALASLAAGPGVLRAGDSNDKTAPMTFGADDGGGLGAKLRLRLIDTVKTWKYKESTGTVYWGGNADGVWSSEESSKNEIEVGAEAGYVTNFSTMESTSEQLLTAAFSFVGRRGQFADENNVRVTHEDYLYGPKVIYRFSWEGLNDFLSEYAGDLGERPSIAAGYYRIGGENANPAELPEGLRADEYYAQLRFEVPAIPVVNGTNNRSVMLSVLAQSSRPVEGQDRSWKYFFDGTLSMNTEGAWRPAITYRSGEKDGFKYDSQLILGLTWDLFAKKR